jgi:hypothetical protein
MTLKAFCANECIGVMQRDGLMQRGGGVAWWCLVNRDSETFQEIQLVM